MGAQANTLNLSSTSSRRASAEPTLTSPQNKGKGRLHNTSVSLSYRASNSANGSSTNYGAGSSTSHSSTSSSDGVNISTNNPNSGNTQSKRSSTSRLNHNLVASSSAGDVRSSSSNRISSTNNFTDNLHSNSSTGSSNASLQFSIALAKNDQRLDHAVSSTTASSSKDETPVPPRLVVAASNQNPNTRGSHGSRTPTTTSADESWMFGDAGPSTSASTSQAAPATTTTCLMECGCCFGDTDFEQMVQCSEGHLFCMDCLRRYAEEAIHGQGKVRARWLLLPILFSLCVDIHHTYK